MLVVSAIPVAQELQGRRRIRDWLGDRVLFVLTLLAALAALATMGAIVWKIVDGTRLSYDRFGLAFLWGTVWDPVKGVFGAGPLIYGTAVTCLVALVVATPLAIAIALYLSELAPRGLRGIIGALVELLAAIPSVVLGLWGILVMAPFLGRHVEPWLHRHLGFVPIFGGEPQPGGLGILTAGLLDAGAAVTAVELDRGLAERLRGRFADEIARGTDDPGAPGGLRLIEGDALDLPLTRLLSEPYEVVANLPYHITSPTLHRLLGEPPRPERLVLMVQREVAERIAAPPGKMSYLSVFVQYHAAVRIARRVPPAAFEPAPEVDSAVIVIDPFPADDRLDRAAEEELWRLVQAAFRERRKMIHNVLARQLPIPADRVAAALVAAGIAPDRRPQTVAVGEWIRLLELIGPIGPDLRGR